MPTPDKVFFKASLQSSQEGDNGMMLGMQDYKNLKLIKADLLQAASATQ